MKTKIVSSEEFLLAVSLLKEGDVVAIPTETVYGLAACTSNESALKKIFTVKGRPSDNPLICHVSNFDQVLGLSNHIPKLFYTFAERFWPGPLTLVIPKHPGVCNIISPNLSSIAIRMPSHKAALDIISHTGPLAAPSANISGKPSPTSAFDVFEDLSGKIPLIVDGGDCEIGIESTVISLMEEKPVLLRPGSLSKITLQEALQINIGDVSENSPIMSPGMKYRHYAPKASVRLCFHKSQLEGPCILSPNPTSGARLLTESTLYAELRRADRLGMSRIDIDCSGSIMQNQALMNRLVKASNG